MSETMMTQNFPDDELQRRRAQSRRIAWLLGAAVLALYLIGMFIRR